MTVVVMWGSRAPAISVGYGEPMWPGDSGFSVIGRRSRFGPLPEGVSVAHLGCLLDDHPELGRGLDLAREHGVASLDENGEWVAGELEDD